MSTPRRALVTGGASPIGAAICRRLADAGCAVIVHAHGAAPAARALAAEIGGEALITDLTDEPAARAAMATLLAAGPVQIIVHNAGIHDDAPLAGMAFARWKPVIDVSLHGFYAAVQPLLLPMIATRWGRIIALSSVAARLGNRGQSNYAAAKAGLEGAVRALAREVASRGITVNAVAPGVIESPAAARAFDASAIKALVPAGRAGRAEEVAALIGFLASDQAGYITGQTIAINGGMA